MSLSESNARRDYRCQSVAAVWGRPFAEEKIRAPMKFRRDLPGGEKRPPSHLLPTGSSAGTPSPWGSNAGLTLFLGKRPSG